MKSILENRPALAAEVEKVAEVAGYLWQKGWAERNGGNITVNITEYYHNSSFLEYGGSPDKAVKTAFVSTIDKYLKAQNKYNKNSKHLF